MRRRADVRARRRGVPTSGGTQESRVGERAAAAVAAAESMAKEE